MQKFLNTFEFENFHDDTDLDHGLIGLVNTKLLKRLGKFKVGHCWDTVWLDMERGTATCYINAGDDTEDVELKIGLTQLPE